MKENVCDDWFIYIYIIALPTPRIPGFVFYEGTDFELMPYCIKSKLGRVPKNGFEIQFATRFGVPWGETVRGQLWPTELHNGNR